MSLMFKKYPQILQFKVLTNEIKSLKAQTFQEFAIKPHFLVGSSCRSAALVSFLSVKLLQADLFGSKTSSFHQGGHDAPLMSPPAQKMKRLFCADWSVLPS